MNTLPQGLEDWLSLVSPTKRSYVTECWTELQAGRRLPANTKAWAATARSRVLDVYRRENGEDAFSLLGDVMPEAPASRRRQTGERKPRIDRGRSRLGLTTAMLAKRQEIIDKLDFEGGRIGGPEYHQALKESAIPSRRNGLTIDSPEVIKVWGASQTDPSPEAEPQPEPVAASSVSVHTWEEAKRISGLAVAWTDLGSDPVVKTHSNETDEVLDPLEEAENLSNLGLSAFS